MSLSKINFADKTVETFAIVDENGVEWMVANPFAEALGYSNANKAVWSHVSKENCKEFGSLRYGWTYGGTNEPSHIPRNIQAKTKFINRAGVFELINASEMPAAKRFKSWNSNDLLPTLCQEGEYSMTKNALLKTTQGMTTVKVQFTNKNLEVISLTDENNELWMLANPFARILEYSNAPKAISMYVTENNQLCLEQIRSAQLGQTCMTSSFVQAKSKFINRAGLFELIQGSKMPRAQEFKQWINSDLLPKLCDNGEYNMVIDAPMKIAEGMSAMYSVTNDGKEAPWMKDLNHLNAAIVKKDKVISTITKQNQDLVTALQISNKKLTDANTNLAEVNKSLILFANEMISARKDCEQARKETAELATRIAHIAQDVITKPSNPQLLHSLAVCSMGGDQYAFLRPQKRSLKRSLNRLSVEDRDIVFFSQTTCPTR